ncbi:helix-turn-helix domain-containing protein [Micromonospora thermarum]|uniref:Helix-turn-helix transcriptional regulator n=1 Tax=Micromonospora thermarum TaxID=2720024 RepID=A0ABX0ZCA5_9ACTN|nr:helix-turn-helix transcriptional regulator [Micromonospora thermarum]NJP33726.1 helix-turn-helix transcriptional regulator [Micromonospora thermarum]
MRQTTRSAHPSPNIEVDGAAIRELRKDLGETISSFAPKVPMSVGYLAQIERGDRPRVSPPNFRRLALALGVRPEKIKKRAAA